MKLMGRLFLNVLTIAVAILFLEACQGSDEKESESNTLFRKLSSRDTGIDFSNRLHETDSFNIIFFEFFYNGSGVAVGDINNDGLSDIFFGGNMVPSKLYLNKGGLSFDDITESAGIDTEGKWVTGLNMVDINQDGKLDIYVCAGGNIGQSFENLFYINTSNENKVSFSESARAIGLDDDGYSMQSAFFDYDKDGDLDMYLLTSSMEIPNKNEIRGRKNDGSVINTDHFYRNDGVNPSTGLPLFKDISKEAGIRWDGFGLGLVVCDINKDQWPDVYVANDYISNDLLYVNQRDGTFKEMFQDYFKHSSFSAMGTDAADINNDGLVDLFMLDMLPEDNYRKKTMATNTRSIDRFLIEKKAGYASQYVRNTLQLNNGVINGKHTFSEIGQLAGVFETDWSWVPLFADFDNDGYRDLFVGNGIVRDFTNMDFTSFWSKEVQTSGKVTGADLVRNLRRELDKKGPVKKPNHIYRNTGNLLFDDKTTEWGFDEPSFTNSAAFSDLDNDGDLDLVLNNINDPAFVYENVLIGADSLDNQGRFLEIRLVGDSLNTVGIGASIHLFYAGQQQYYEHFPVRGYLSMVDPQIHFGVGGIATIDSLIIVWPDGKEQLLQNVKTNQLLTLHASHAREEKATYKKHDKEQLFVDVSNTKGLVYKHTEKEFIDYKFQPLIPHQYSKEGPGLSVGDVNGDEREDFFIGGSLGYAGNVFVQQANGSFEPTPLPGDRNNEDMGSLFFDADNDGDADLYVVSGGSGLPARSPYYQDRLYINDGNGRFSKAEGALPGVTGCGSVVTAADYDKDGDLDLFVGGRVDLERYPLPDRSFLLRNDSDSRGARFTDVTQKVNPSLATVGLVAAALWTDFNQDGWVDLLVAGEWMPITFFKNEAGKFVDVTTSTGLANYTGWWSSLNGADFDKDGDIDYVAGNLGLNTPYQISQDHPMRIIAKDFDNNGAIDPVCTYYIQGTNYPMYNRDLLIGQLPSLKKKFLSYHGYAVSSTSDIFSKTEMEGAYVADSRWHASSYLENNGDGTYSVYALRIEAQFSPVFGILANDYNNDGNTDLLLAGNSYDLNSETGQYDASIGLFLSGDGQGNFTSVAGHQSGFFADGDVKGMAELLRTDGSNLILIAQNSDSLKAYSTGGKRRIIRLKKNDGFADLYYKNGRIERKEFYHGSGYLSQSSRIIAVPGQAISIKITNYSDGVREIVFNSAL